MDRFIRQKLLIGDYRQEKLFKSKVVVFGVGGVGGYCVEMLARCGIGEIIIVDYDKVDITNINRQIIALETTVGQNKVDLIKERILQINPSCKVIAINKKLTLDNINTFPISDSNFIIDCIDDVKAKVKLVVECKNLKIPCISAMGTGNRIGVPKFEVSDIYKTENDPLARRLRKLLKDACVKKHFVVYSKQSLTKVQINPVGSYAPFPAVCGCTLAGYVLTKLLEE